MDNLDEIAKELKQMDKSKRKEMLTQLSRDPKIMEQVAGLMDDPGFRKKLKDLLK